MENYIIRLSSLTLVNIKNVKKGTIVMPSAKNKNSKSCSADILGVYGQNGSGKTAIVDSLYFLQHIITGQELDQDIIDYIDVNASTAELSADFNIFLNDICFEVEYHITFSKSETGINIKREYLTCATNKDNERTNKNIFMDYTDDDNDPVFKPQKRLDELTGKNKELKLDLLVAKKIAKKSNCSYIFGESSREIFFNNINDEFKIYSFIINQLFIFGIRNLFVIRNTHSGMITANFALPMAFRIENDKTGIKGDFAVPLMKPVILNSKRKELLYKIVEQINTVLYTIIPGMKIEINNYGKQALDSGDEGWKIELMSARNNQKPIPIRMESEGIIKIISILNALIQAFGNPSVCLVIDELDAGIFEYMLGELLDIFKENAKGQLIFTSHNLRALEMIDKESIMFSTVNPDNRYIHMKNVKGSNNLRSMYIRSITLGGQKEKIYEETDSLKIARAFRKAGREINNE